MSGPKVVESRVSPFTGKLVWILLIASGILLAIPIILAYRGEAGFLWLLAFIGAIYPLYKLWQWQYYRERRKRP